MILTAIVCLLSGAAHAGQFTTCYVEMLIPNSAKNIGQVISNLPSYGITGTYATNMGVISTIIKRENNATYTKTFADGNYAYNSVTALTVKLESTEAQYSAEDVKAAMQSSLKTALDTLKKSMPAHDQKFFSVFINGCFSVDASDGNEIK